MKKILSFTAEWCPNCPRMKPVLAQLEKDGYSVTIKDVETEEFATQKYQVKSLPTTIIIGEQGEELDRVVGARPYSFMQDLLKD